MVLSIQPFIGTENRIILKRTFNRKGGWAWNGFLWLRTGTSGGTLRTRWRIFRFHSTQGISWLAEELVASQGRRCSMEFVRYNADKSDDSVPHSQTPPPSVITNSSTSNNRQPTVIFKRFHELAWSSLNGLLIACSYRTAPCLCSRMHYTPCAPRRHVSLFQQSDISKTNAIHYLEIFCSRQL